MPWDIPELPWTTEALDPGAVIGVRPAVGDAEIAIEACAALTRPETAARRLADAEQLAAEIGWSLPGELAVQVSDVWSGRFEVGSWRPTDRRAVRQALRQGPIDPALAGSAVGRGAVLVTWVDAIDLRPLSCDGIPGEIVLTRGQPAVIDLFDEPWRARATLGAALVSPEGQVLARVTDTIDAVLSDQQGAAHASRAISRDLADQFALVWPVP